MGKNTVIAFLAMGVFILVGCGTSGEKVDSVESVVGTWHRVGGGLGFYCRASSDGTYICSETVEKIDNNEGSKGEYWFEGTQYFEQSGLCPEAGVYEIYLQPNGNLKYVVIEDECVNRISANVGSGSTEGKIEWEPVP